VYALAVALFEAANRLIHSFVEFGVPRSLHGVTPINRPSESDVGNLVVSIAELPWASFRSELRPLLTKLKVLDRSKSTLQRNDWCAAAADFGGRRVELGL